MSEVVLDTDVGRYWHYSVMIDPIRRLNISERGYNILAMNRGHAMRRV